jgi:hypothetical protein
MFNKGRTSYNVFFNFEGQCIQFHINFLLFINGDGMHFYIHNLNNYNLHVMPIGHDGEKWCHDNTMSTKLFKNIIIVLHKLQDNTISKSLVIQNFQNLF